MKNLELKDFYNYNFLSGLTFNPSRTKAVFAVKKADVDNNSYRSDLWLLDTADDSVKRLTGAGDVGAFLWRNDEEVLFSAMRDKTLAEKVKNGETHTAFYCLPLSGGEAVEYFRLPYAVSGIKAVAEDKFVLTLAKDTRRPDIEAMEEGEKAKALARQKAEKDYEVIDELPFWGNGAGFTNAKRDEIYIFDAVSGRLTAVSTAPADSGVFDVKDGKVLYNVSEFDKGLGKLKNGLWLYDTGRGESKCLIPEKDYSIRAGGFSADKIWALATDNSQYGLNQNPKLYFVSENGDMSLWLDKDISYGSSVGSDCRLGGGKSFYSCNYGVAFISTERCSSVINTLTLDGRHDVLPMASGSVDCFDKSKDTLYFIGMRENRLQELYKFSGGKEIKLTGFNDEIFRDKYIAVPQYFAYENDGVELDGFVLLPKDYDESKKYPAILDIHGGPKTVFGDVIYHEMQAWANMGYFVFFTNPRGGDGRGNEFADIRGRYGKEDYSDLMKFTDEVLERYPRIDKARVGVTGGSYGGFMTNWIIGHTDRFAAAASQRSISNWVSMGYISDIGYYFADDQVGATPWNDVRLMWEQSPLKYADKVVTPTLFIHSDEDYRCPLAEGLQMFSALKYHKVDSRLCMFKGENHELSRSGKPLHRRRRLDEITNWFEKYLKA